MQSRVLTTQVPYQHSIDSFATKLGKGGQSGNMVVQLTNKAQQPYQDIAYLRSNFGKLSSDFQGRSIVFGRQRRVS
jgi:hypothetical protein